MVSCLSFSICLSSQQNLQSPNPMLGEIHAKGILTIKSVEPKVFKYLYLEWLKTYLMAFPLGLYIHVWSWESHAFRGVMLSNCSSKYRAWLWGVESHHDLSIYRVRGLYHTFPPSFEFVMNDRVLKSQCRFDFYRYHRFSTIG